MLRGRPRARLIRAARAAAATVRRARWDYAILLADLVTATADHLDGRAIGALLDGLSGRARALDMPQYAEAIAVFHGQRSRDRATGASALRQRGAVDPVRWAAVLLPGVVSAPPWR